MSRLSETFAGFRAEGRRIEAGGERRLFLIRRREGLWRMQKELQD